MATEIKVMGLDEIERDQIVVNPRFARVVPFIAYGALCSYCNGTQFVNGYCQSCGAELKTAHRPFGRVDDTLIYMRCAED